MGSASPLGRYAAAPDDAATCLVELLATPLRLWRQAAEHHDDLQRELALISLSPGARTLPDRLLELVAILGGRYGAAARRPDPERDEALAAGRDRVDLRYEVPVSAGAAAAEFRAMLDEVESFCREGTELLTLGMPPVLLAFSHWYTDQIQAQCAGAPATPWPGPWQV